MADMMVKGTLVAALLLSAGLCSVASAAPSLRDQVDQHGDVLVIGNVLGQDCDNNTPAPVVGSVGECGSNVSDSSPDIFWRADAPAAGGAEADLSIDASQARSTAVLELPAGAEVTHAWLYWAAMSPDGEADSGASIERPGVFAAAVAQDAAHGVASDTELLYESVADVTLLVQEHGSGAYRISDVGSMGLSDINDARRFAAWSMVVFYRLDSEPLRQLTLFDGLDPANTGSGIVVNISGFLIPSAGIDAKLGIVAYGGDGQTGGDSLTFNGSDLSDGQDATNKFFNGSRTLLGSPVSVSGDLPQLSGGKRSHSAVDIDVMDVSTLVSPGGNSATVEIKSGGDGNVLLGALFTSITTFKPNFNESIKAAEDLNGGAVLAGDVLRYSIEIVNTGNDPAVGVVMEDPLPSGVEFVSGSLAVDGVAQTDAVDGDQGEYLLAERTLVARLGVGADASQGGTMAIGDSVSVVFDVLVTDAVLGLVSNQVRIRASGENGAPEATFTTTDGAGSDTTDVVVDGCQNDGDCPAAEPHCLIAESADAFNRCVVCIDDGHCSGTTPVCSPSDHSCVPCGSDIDCSDPATPACQLDGVLAGACTECSSTNDAACAGNRPQCLLAQGVCGCSDSDGDSECGASDSGRICNGPAGSCVPGCSSAEGRNLCPMGQYCDDLSGAVGSCVTEDCVDDGDCSDPLPICDTGAVPNRCVQCLLDQDCEVGTICDTAGDKTCVQCTAENSTACSSAGAGTACLDSGSCGCTGDADCGGNQSGRVCDSSVSRCTVGCRGEGGNGCPATLVCTSSSSEIGQCVACLDDADCGGDTPRCDTSSELCVQCLDASDCGSDAPVCSQGACVGCSSDADCGDAERPACQQSGALAGSCQQCSGTNLERCDAERPLCLANATCGCSDSDGDSECGAGDSGRVCNGPAGFCVDGCSTATSRNDCPASQVCSEQDGDLGQCLSHCLSDADCSVAPALVCDTSESLHVCVQCLGDAHCASAEVCNVETRRCVQCLDDADCDGTAVCDTSSLSCVQCIDDTDCDGGQLCDGSTLSCVQCIDDTDCDAGMLCDGGTLSCVQCVTDAQCDVGTLCDGTTLSCVQCVDDADCDGGQLCDGTTLSCVDCASDADCEPGMVCDGASSRCVDCVVDADCDSGMVCDGTSLKCVDCLSDGDCAGPTVCDGDSGGCVGCLQDADCGSDQVCEVSTMRCVQCVASNDAACEGHDAGARCLTNNRCGCTDDSDCGDSDSGRVCDEQSQLCVDGCRGDGGNGCPSGQMCSSGSQAIGSCEPLAPEPEPEPTVDAGTDGTSKVGGGGCDCSVPSRGGQRPPLAGLLGFGLVLLRITRSRRNRGSRRSRRAVRAPNAAG
ncbi:MAG: DUF3344 domain-containing protein [Myxococcales bacterium]|nr:DUF3344 domain-containing protein [Myxococcales bacterium]